MDGEIKKKWENLVKKLSDQFADGEEVDLDGILFLIGVHELGSGFRKFNKNEKMDVMHIAICKLLSKFGYYSLIGMDEQGWPHYELNENLPSLKAGAQTILLKQAVVEYFEEIDY